VDYFKYLLLMLTVHVGRDFSLHCGTWTSLWKRWDQFL